jgi:hypothetical protein
MKRISFKFLTTGAIVSIFLFLLPFVFNSKVFALTEADEITVSTGQYTVLSWDVFVLSGTYFGNTQKKPLTTYFEYKRNDSNLDEAKDRKETIKIVRNTNVDESNTFFTNPELHLASTYYFRAVGYLNDNPSQKFYGGILSLTTSSPYIGSLLFNNLSYCESPQIRNIFSNACITPVTCESPQIRNIFSNACITPVTCELPEVRDIMTNKCVTSVICKESEVLNIMTNECDPVIDCSKTNQVRNIFTNQCETQLALSTQEPTSASSFTLSPSTFLTLPSVSAPSSALEPTTPPPSTTNGLVTCTENCGFNEFLALVNRVIRFILFNLAVPISAIMFAYAGFLMVTSGGSTESRKKAKSVFTSTAIGLVCAAGAWLIVKTLLSILSSPETWAWIGF